MKILPENRNFLCYVGMIEPRNLSIKFKPLLQLHAVLCVPESDFLFEFNSRHAEYYKVLLYIEKLFKLFLSILDILQK